MNSFYSWYLKGVSGGSEAGVTEPKAGRVEIAMLISANQKFATQVVMSTT